MSVYPSNSDQIFRTSGVTSGERFAANDYIEPWDLEPPIPDVPDWEFEEAAENLREFYNMSPTQFVESTILMPNPETRSLEPFSFKDRPYLRRVYNTPSKRTLYMCGRQVEKSKVEFEPILSADGQLIPIKDIQVGDQVACLETFERELGDELGMGADSTTSQVLWKSKRYKKPCVRITTRQGHVSAMATTHPVRTWNGYTDAGDLVAKVRGKSRGSKIAVVRHAGEFPGEEQPSARVRITGFMIGDGSCSRTLGFHSKSHALLDDFHRALEERGMSYTPSLDKRSGSMTLRLPQYKAVEVYDWFDEDGLRGTDSYTKFVPDWVFRLSREQTALFLNRLWSTDGHVKMNSETKWSIEYCSMSERLIRQVQSLLWKFGIPSSVRKNWLNIYKERGEEVYSYILRLATQEGIRTFVREIGALGRIECHEMEPWEENNNRDTYPPEVTELVREIYNAVGPTKGDRTLRSCGIERLPRREYLLTRDKLQTYVDFFRGDERYDQRKVDLLDAHINSDIYWDEVEEIEDIGDQWCYDIAVADHHNFISGGMFTHNSTTLGNKAIALSALIPHFRVLYVSPSNTQTKEFSKTRLKEILETCPDLKTWFPDRLTDNVYEKKAINRSQITLRYAFLNADRVRGLSADYIAIDEFQDILLENIPVIEESASHSPFKFFSYSGTPKSLDNPIQYYWHNFSTQNEWVVPCEHHGVPNNPGSWHWNVLGEKNIGKEGVICDRCGKPLNVQHSMAQWVRTNTPDEKYDTFEGFRIPQLMVPWMEWSNILTKYEQYSRAKFFNECLGISFDSGQRPLTQQDLIDNCDPNASMSKEYIARIRQEMTGPIYAGIDWGQDSTNSYTILTLGTYLRGYFTIFWAHRFQGQESDTRTQMQKIKRIINAFNVKRVGVDYGGGHWPNDELLKTFGSQRIVRYQYSTPSVYAEWKTDLARYLVHKHEVMGKVFTAIKRKNVFRFPRWKEFSSPYGADMLSIFSEYNERTHMTEYKRSPNTTDDTFHSLVYCFMASMIDYPRPDILTPSQSVDSQMGWS